MTDKVKNIVNSFQSGFVFIPNDFGVEVSKQSTVNRILNNMVAAGKICRLSKGRFYKPRITQFSELQPDTYQIVKDLIEKSGKTIGCITGYTTFNQLLLTTQIPVTLQIGRAKEKIYQKGYLQNQLYQAAKQHYQSEYTLVAIT